MLTKYDLCGLYGMSLLPGTHLQWLLAHLDDGHDEERAAWGGMFDIPEGAELDRRLDDAYDRFMAEQDRRLFGE